MFEHTHLVNMCYTPGVCITWVPVMVGVTTYFIPQYKNLTCFILTIFWCKIHAVIFMMWDIDVQYKM